MSFLLPQSRRGTVRVIRPVDIHGDRYIDIQLDLDDAPGEPITGRVSASECAAGLAVGERAEARLVMGVIVKVERA